MTIKSYFVLSSPVPTLFLPLIFDVKIPITLTLTGNFSFINLNFQTQYLVISLTLKAKCYVRFCSKPSSVVAIYDFA